MELYLPTLSKEIKIKYISELQGIDKVKKNLFYHILKWKHPSIWQVFWCDGKLPFDDYDFLPFLQYF